MAKRVMENRKDKPVPELPWEECGAAMHTALRKVCDSKITSLAYNVVRLVDAGWSAYARLVAAELAAGSQPVAAAKTAAAKLDHLDERQEGNEWLTKEKARSEQMALVCTFALFTPIDWECFAAYLEHVEFPARTTGGA